MSTLIKNFINKHGLLYQTRYLYLYICIYLPVFVYICLLPLKKAAAETSSEIIVLTSSMPLNSCFILYINKMQE